jgi:uncharacterized protein
MEFWPALLFGFLGSAHCAGMCGPLALALPGTGSTRAAFLAGRAAYNSGRIVTYAALGALFGLLGHAFVIAGFQRWVSLAAGAAILLGVLVSPKFLSGVPLTGTVGWLKQAFGALLRRRTFGSLFGLGLLNGLLPCGLVYAACAGATATGGVLAGAGYMAVFGAGTLPMMLAFSLAGPPVQVALRSRLQRLVPVSLALVGALLVLRGLGLGIPYVSPALPAQPCATNCCH